MRAWPPRLAPDDHWRVYETSTESERRAIRAASARYRYDYEQDIGFFDRYFPTFETAELHGRSLLDLGCFTGGQLVWWVERYGLIATGIDVEEKMAQAGREFAETQGVPAKFDVGFAEELPYADSSFDYITAYDVFEHVRDVDLTLQECHRILKPGGKLLTVFPPLFQPLEAHLGQATGMPALQWIFSGPVLAQAHYEVSRRHGSPYAKPKLESWERLPSLNGITVRRFRKLIAQGWDLCYWGTDPIFSDGRRARHPFFSFGHCGGFLSCLPDYPSWRNFSWAGFVASCRRLETDRLQRRQPDPNPRQRAAGDFHRLGIRFAPPPPTCSG